MGTMEKEKQDQQRLRRKRINRIKNGIVTTIAIWMIFSLLAIIILSVLVFQLNRRLSHIEESGLVMPDSRTERNLPDTQISGEPAPTPAEDYSGVVKGIDSEENLAVEGDVHQVYLTFDCVPGSNTEAILNVLNQYQIKATFFVTGDESEEAKAIYQRIVNEGHTLGMHSYSNQYHTIYASADAFYQDYKEISDYLYEVTGVKSTYYRFPGGSSNEISNVNMAEFVKILNQEQVVYYDWNVSAGDAASDYTVEDVVSNVTDGVSRYKTSVVLLHDDDGKSTTAEALGPLIEALKNMQAQILPIDENTNVIQYIKADSVG